MNMRSYFQEKPPSKDVKHISSKKTQESKIVSKTKDELTYKPNLKLVVKPKNDSKPENATYQKEKINDYRLKVGEGSSALKLTFIKPSKDSGKQHSAPHSKSQSAPRDHSSSSGGSKSSHHSAENRAKHGDGKGHSSSSRDHKYEKYSEKNGKHAPDKSSSHSTKSHKVASKSHDSTKKSAVPKEKDAVEMKKQHRSAEMSITAAKPETKHDGRGDKSAKPAAAADSKKVVVSDGYLRRKFGCRRLPKVLLHRMTKEEIHRATRRTNKNPNRRPVGPSIRPKTKTLALNSKIDKKLQASALMDLLKPTAGASAPTPRPKIIFAPRRVVKCHNTAATAAPLGKQRRPPQSVSHSHSQQHERRKTSVPSKTFPREMIGLIERDIERAVPLERFVNNKKRSAKIDWLVLDGKMQYASMLRQPMQRSVKLKILMPPQHYATDEKYQVEEQLQLRNEAIAKYMEQNPPQKVQSQRARESHANVRKYMELKVN